MADDLTFTESVLLAISAVWVWAFMHSCVAVTTKEARLCSRKKRESKVGMETMSGREALCGIVDHTPGCKGNLARGTPVICLNISPLLSPLPVCHLILASVSHKSMLHEDISPFLSDALSVLIASELLVSTF